MKLCRKFLEVLCLVKNRFIEGCKRVVCRWPAAVFCLSNTICSSYVIHLLGGCAPSARVLKILSARVLKILISVYQYRALSRINKRYARNAVSCSHNIEIEKELIIGFTPRFIYHFIKHLHISAIIYSSYLIVKAHSWHVWCVIFELVKL